MRKVLYIKRGTFITKQGFIQSFLLLFVCIGIPGIFTYLYDDYSWITDAFSSLLTSFCFIIMVSIPIIAFLLVIFGNIEDSFGFKMNSQGIKAISFYDECICLHCNQKSYDKTLRFDEIKYVMFERKQANVFNPNTTSKGFKFGGVGLASIVARNSSSKVTYEVDLTIMAKNAKQYTITIAAMFSNNPYKKIEKVKDFFKNKNIKVVELS